MTRDSTIFEYLKTVALTIVAIFVFIFISLFIVQYQVYENKNTETTQNDVVEYYLVGVLIEKNKYLESIYPENYKINLKLGVLYEIYRDKVNAEKEYILAQTKAPYDDYKPAYRLASFYAKNNRLTEAQKIMDDIPEKPQKALIDFKGEVYYQIGEKYYTKGNYVSAIEKYNKSLFYLQKTKSPLIKDVKASLVSAYVYQADYFVDSLNINEAIQCLEKAKNIINAPLVEYKLALLMLNSDPKQSAKYMENVYKATPEIINPEIYYNLLNQVADMEDAQGGTVLANLYRFKAKSYKKFVYENILYLSDIAIRVVDKKAEIHKNKINLQIDLILKNTSKEPLANLKLFITFKEDGQITDEYEQPVTDGKFIIEPNADSPTITIKTIKKYSKKKASKSPITVEVSAAKNEKYKLNLLSFTIDKEQ